MVCSFSTFTYNDDNPNGISYIRTCYENARHYIKGRDGDVDDGDSNKDVRFHNTAKTYLLTVGLMEQGQFTPIDKLLDCYPTHDTDEEMIVDEEAMKEKHPWLHDVYVTTKSRGALTWYLSNLNVEAQTVKVRTNCVTIYKPLILSRAEQELSQDYGESARVVGDTVGNTHERVQVLVSINKDWYG